MKQQILFPIRLKILMVLLLVVTVVVSLITFTMANLFHADKTAYIHDLTSVMAMHTGEETRSVLEGYRERLRTYVLVLKNDEITGEKKIEMVNRLVADFDDFVAIMLHDRNGGVESTIYDAEVLEKSGVSKQDLLDYRSRHPFPMADMRDGRVFVENSTVSSRLPTLTLGLVESGFGSGDSVTVSAVLKLDRLLNLASRPGAFETSVLDARGVFLADPDIARVVSRQKATALPGSLGELQEYGMTREYAVGGVDMVGGFAGATIGGVLAVVQIPKSAAYLTSRELLRNLILIALALLIASAVISLVLSRLMTRAVERLSTATKAIGQGQFDVHVDIRSHDEIGMLAGSFNQMAGELKARDEALTAAQGQLIQSEKMAAFGQLGAGIAHEVKNPLAGILGCAQLSLLTVEKSSPLEKNLKLIEKETKRCKMIIENLMKFARQEKAEMQAIRLDQVVEDAAAIVDHQLSLNKVTLGKNMSSDLPPVLGNANQLQQVLMNLIINAQQAMEGAEGAIEVTAMKKGDNHVEVRVSDNGPGIPPEHRSRLFEPFFTTKRQGKGTGLGLSVSYGIVQDHGGNITVESEVGKGTTFVLSFPAVHSEDNSVTQADDGMMRKAG